jgi:hypothetical protein
MYVIRRILPVVVSLVTLVLFELSLQRPATFVIIVGVLVIFITIASLLLLNRARWSTKVPLTFLPTPAIIGTAATIFFLSANLARHGIIVGLAFSLFIYFEEIYRFQFEPAIYHHHAFENLVSFLSFVSVSALVSGLFGFYIFLTMRLLFLLPIAFILTFFICVSVLSIQPIDTVSLWMYSFLMTILVIELIWVVHYLPSHYWVDGLLVSIPFYTLFNLIRHEIGGTATKRHIQRYALICVAALLMIAGTAQWVA